jgi:hypothetical protein
MNGLRNLCTRWPGIPSSAYQVHGHRKSAEELFGLALAIHTIGVTRTFSSPQNPILQRIPESEVDGFGLAVTRSNFDIHYALTT